MLLVIGIALVGFSFFLGIPGRFYVDNPDPGQVLLILGAAMLTWSCLQAFPKILSVIPAGLGILMMLQGTMTDDFLPFVSGVVLFTIALFTQTNIKLPRPKKG